MARVQNTLIGRASGSVGQVVFLTWRLINVTRAKPTSVANPDTILQQQQRNRFGQTVGLYNLSGFPADEFTTNMQPLLQLGLKNRNRKMTLFNFFQKLNQQSCFDNVGDGSIAFLPENLKLSYGLEVTAPATITTANVGSNQFVWTSDTSNVNAGNYDNLFAAAVWNETQNVWIFRLNAGLYRLSSHSFNLGIGNNLQSGDVLHLWQFNYNPYTLNSSDTFYATVTV